MRSILVVNPKGGCGETTISTNLAGYYAVWGVRAAERRVGIFEMGPAAVAEDLEQWRPLVNWIEGGKVKTR